MGPLLRIPVIRTLHERQLLFPAVVALVVSGVLVHGAWRGARPADTTAQEQAPAPLPLPTSRRPDLEKTPLTYFDDYWSQLRERTETRIVLVGPDAAAAVVVMPGLALTSAAAGEAARAEAERARLVGPSDGPPAGDSDTETDAGPAAGRPAGGEPLPDEAGAAASPSQAPVQTSRPGGLIALDREAGLALFEVDASRVPAFELIPPAAVPSGSYVGAVTRDRTGRAAITPGYLVWARAEPDEGGVSLEVSMPLARAGATAIVDLDGALVGVAIGPGGPERGPRLMSSSVVRRVVAELQRQTRCRAFVVSELAPSVLSLLGIERGLLLERIRADAFSPEPSLRAGDVILDWDGEPVTTAEAFETRSATIEPGTLVRYRVLRGLGRLAGGTVQPDDCRPVGEPPVRLARFGLAVRWTAGGDPARDGWRVAATAPGGAAAAAGLLHDDLVLAVAGREVEGLDARAVFEQMDRRGEPTVVTVQRADRVVLLALEPGD